MHFRVLDNGKLPEGVKATLARIIPTYAGKEMVLTLEPAKKRRSLSQNSFFHGPFLDALTDMFLEAGNDIDRDTVKDIAKEKFGLRVSVTMPDGVIESKPKSTREYTTTEIEEFMEKIRAWAARYDHQLPFPNETEA